MGSLIGADTFKWEDADKRQNIMFRLPRNIRFNDNIVVREDEIAVFYRDGRPWTTSTGQTDTRSHR
jgi:hypothetical protein